MKDFLRKIIMLLCSLGVTLICLFLGHRFYVEVDETKAWRKITVTVVSTAVIKEVRQKGTAYCPKIGVSFEQAGVSYTSDLEISQEPCGPIKQSIGKIANTFSVGKSLEVFVNPSKPSAVRLSTYSLGWVFYITVFCGVLMFMVAIAVLRQLFRGLRTWLTLRSSGTRLRRAP